MAVDILPPGVRNGSSVLPRQENGLNWLNQKDGNGYRGFMGASNEQGSSLAVMSHQDVLNGAGVNVTTSNGISMETEDVRCSSVTLEKASFTQVLNASSHQRPVHPAPAPPVTSSVSGCCMSLSSISNTFEPAHFNFLDSLNEAGLPSNPAVHNQINIPDSQYFIGTYNSQEEEFLNPFGPSFSDIL